MIDLSDDNDPMLFAVQVPAGKLVLQYMEAVAALQAMNRQGEDPTPADIVKAIRETTRTPDVGKSATDQQLIAAWHRMTVAIQKQGNA